jgi:hypothetical protein
MKLRAKIARSPQGARLSFKLLKGSPVSTFHSPFRKHRSPPLGLPSGRNSESRDAAKKRSAFESLETRSLMAATVAADYAVSENWGSGFQASIKLSNQQAVAVNNWVLEFDYGAKISSLWDGKITSHTGTHYVVSNAGWNSTLAAGGQVSFGFVAAPGSGPTGPINYLLNRKPLGDFVPTPVVPSITISDVSIAEGNSGTKNATFTVTLSNALTSAVTVNYATRNGTATAGATSDYTAASGKLTFAAGQTSKTVNVSIIGDTVFESDENFYLDLSAAVGATLARSTATGAITNDDTVPPPPPPDPGTGQSAAVQFNVTNDWGSGFNGDVSVRNTGTSAVKNWQLQFTFAGTISSIWNASIVSHTGNQYVIKGASWNADLVAGATTSFGFTASPGGAAAKLSTFVFTGTASPGGGDNGGNDGGNNGNNGSNQPLAYSQVVWPKNYYAPYVDSTLWPLYDFVGTAKTSGLKFFTLAFITADTANKPAWGGFAAYDVGTTDFDAQMKTNIAALRAIGGDVMVSFGGAANQDMAEVITDVNALVNSYQSVITAYGLTHIDFDIEGAAVANKASVDRRNQAIAILQQNAAAAGRKLDVWYTLPVLPTGLTTDGVYLVQSALRNGVNLSGVNIMTMDYGDSAAPNPRGKMGDYSIQAATSLFNQLKTAYGGSQTDAQLWAKVGITPMIGMNDVQTEIFDQQEAREVLAFAQSHGISRISIWSLNRDYQNSAGAINHVDNFSSSLVQSPLEFSLLFNQVTVA